MEPRKCTAITNFLSQASVHFLFLSLRCLLLNPPFHCLFLTTHFSFHCPLSCPPCSVFHFFIALLHCRLLTPHTLIFTSQYSVITPHCFSLFTHLLLNSILLTPHFLTLFTMLNSLHSLLELLTLHCFLHIECSEQYRLLIFHYSLLTLN